MAVVTFTQNLQRHVELPECAVAGATLRDVLEAVFRTKPAARSYVLDDTGAVRHHVVVFVDGRQAQDRSGLSDPVTPTSRVHVMQALSGG